MVAGFDEFLKTKQVGLELLPLAVSAVKYGVEPHLAEIHAVDFVSRRPRGGFVRLCHFAAKPLLSGCPRRMNIFFTVIPLSAGLALLLPCVFRIFIEFPHLPGFSYLVQNERADRLHAEIKSDEKMMAMSSRQINCIHVLVS